MIFLFQVLPFLNTPLIDFCGNFDSTLQMSKNLDTPKYDGCSKNKALDLFPWELQ